MVIKHGPETSAHARHRRAPVSIVVQPSTIWAVAAIAVGLALLWIVVTRGLSILILLFVAIIFAEGIRPVVRWLSQSFLPRVAAIGLIYLALLAIFVGLGYLLIEPVVAQATSFFSNLPHYASHLQRIITHAQNLAGHGTALAGGLQHARSDGLKLVEGSASFLITAPLAIGALLFDLATILIMAFFWLTAVEGLKHYVVGLFPRSHQPMAGSVLAEMGEDLGAYVRGVAVNAIIAGVLVGGGLALLGVPYAVLLGVVAGLLQAVPVLGGYASAALGVGVAFLTSGVIKGAEVWAFFVIIQNVQGSVIMPLILRRAISINPLTILVVALLGVAVLGIAGGIIAVPLTITIRVVLDQVVRPELHRRDEAAARQVGTP
ncbi:MAG: AI-2E family transporter [Chloroflexota bacterium]